MDFRQVRKYIYTILVAAGPLVTFYGLADANEVALWLGLGATVLGVPGGGLALANLNPKEEEFEATPDIDDGDDEPKHAA